MTEQERALVKAEALEEAADGILSGASSAWGGSAAWLTTGDKVAAVVADWLRTDAEYIRAALASPALSAPTTEDGQA